MAERRGYIYRILFADDQQEVARTLTGLFRRPDIKVEFATNGEAALEMCRQNRYDLVVVDLQMPPEQWGGLWLIRALRDKSFQIPVLVLSGQAGQPETIEALHLSAKGFVLKHRAQEELRDRVTALLGRARTDTRYAAARRLPMPIAIWCARTDSAESPAQRLRLTLYALEYALRLTCLVGVAEARHNGGTQATDFLMAVSSTIMSPSMGTSNAVRLAIASRLPDSVAASWARQFDNQLTDAAIAVRNEIAHVQEPSNMAAEEYLETADAALDTYLAAAVSMPNPEIVVINGLSNHGSHYQVSATVLHGDQIALPQRMLSAQLAPLTGHTYLWRTEPIDLWPFITVEPRREVGSLEVSLFDGPATDPRRWQPDDPLRYISVREGKRTKSETYFCRDTGLSPPAVS